MSWSNPVASVRWVAVGVLMGGLMVSGCNGPQTAEPETAQTAAATQPTLPDHSYSWDRVPVGGPWVLSAAPQGGQGIYHLRRQAGTYLLRPELEDEEAAALAETLFNGPDATRNPAVVRHRLTLHGQVEGDTLVLQPSNVLAGRTYRYELVLQDAGRASGLLQVGEVGAATSAGRQPVTLATALQPAPSGTLGAASSPSKQAGSLPPETPEPEPVGGPTTAPPTRDPEPAPRPAPTGAANAPAQWQANAWTEADGVYVQHSVEGHRGDSLTYLLDRAQADGRRLAVQHVAGRLQPGVSPGQLGRVADRATDFIASEQLLAVEKHPAQGWLGVRVRYQIDEDGLSKALE